MPARKYTQVSVDSVVLSGQLALERLDRWSAGLRFAFAVLMVATFEMSILIAYSGPSASGLVAGVALLSVDVLVVAAIWRVHVRIAEVSGRIERAISAIDSIAEQPEK